MNEETSPLLGQQKPTTRWTSVYLLSLHTFFISLAFSLLNTPLSQLIEDNLCHRYTHERTVAQGFCKSDYIQLELANINGYIPVMEAVNRSQAHSLPFIARVRILQAVATRYSRLSITPASRIRIDRSSISYRGGGPAVQLASLNSIASDLATRSDRASSFFMLTFGLLSGGAVGPFIASALMSSHSSWIPILVSISTWPIGAAILMYVPETLSVSKQDPIPEISHAPLALKSNFWKSHISQSILLYKESLASLRSPSAIIIIAINLMEMPEYIATSSFLTQFVSKRFHWSFADTGYLIAMRGVIHMTVLLVALPLLSTLLSRWQHPNMRDLTLARLSAAVAVIGALWMAASRVNLVIIGLALQSLGGGMTPLCRSLALNYVPSSDISRLNTLIGIVGTAGSLLGGPVLTWLFDVGLTKGGYLIGLPYLVFAAAFLLCLVGLLLVQAPMSRDDDEPLSITGIDECVSVDC
ncbi:hypothetical protein N7454_002427 [Penicillium verhagenii]|nr:hypothetical protein N7454_002427 [Penicillium verhagenii]